MKLSRVWAAGAVALILAVPALAQRRGGFGFGGRGGFGGGGFLLRMPEVQKELKLEQPQLDLINQVQQEQGAKMRELGFQPGQPPSQEQIQKMQALQAESQKKIGEILNAAQRTRLKQLEIQSSMQFGGLGAVVGREDLAKELKITPEQQAKIRGEQQAMGESMRAMFQNGGFDFQNATPEQRQEFQKKMQDIRAGADAKIKAILTADQQRQIEAMKGAPFTFPAFGRGGRRGGAQQ
jgi:hypothetical protein